MHKLSRWKYLLNAPKPSIVLQQFKSLWKLPLTTVALHCSVAMPVSCNGAQRRVSSYFQTKQFTCTVQWNAETPAWILKVVKHEKLQCIYLAQNIFSLSGLLLGPELVSLWDSSALHLLSLKAHMDRTGRFQSCTRFCRAAMLLLSL